MKWENCDTNVSKMKTILNFSKLDDVANFLKLFELIFDEAIVEMVNGYYKLYGHRDKGATSFDIFLILTVSFQTVKCIGKRFLILLFCKGNA